MTPKERAAMQAAWVWMDWYASNNGTLEPVDLNETIAALREALAEQAEQEPVAWKKCAFCGIEHQIKSDGYILDTKTDEVFCKKCYVHTHEQEPVGNRIVGNDADGYTVENLYASPQSVNWSDRAVQIRALQAIGAEWYDGKIRNQWIADTCHELTKVIGGASPVRTKDLTDDEIMKINVDTAGIVPTCDRQFHFARAVIAADREKNK